MTQRELAAALGISEAMVSKLKARGMPTASVEAATKWRKRHLEVIRTKAERVDLAQPKRESVGHVSKPAGIPLASAAALARVDQLGMLALDALKGETFEVVAPMLRQAMQAVPPEARDHVCLPVEVWTALTPGLPDGHAGSGAAANDFSPAFAKTFWYQIALGPQLSDHHIVGTLPSNEARNARTGGMGE